MVLQGATNKFYKCQNQLKKIREIKDKAEIKFQNLKYGCLII